VDMHMHSARRLTAWALGLVVLLPLPLSLARPAVRSGLSCIDGTVTYRGRPLTDTMICLDFGGVHSASGATRRDGSFSLAADGHAEGAFPGKYRVHFYRLFPKAEGPSLPDKYRSAETSGLELEIVPDWNHFDLVLQ
jgi:hypothetical protein